MKQIIAIVMALIAGILMAYFGLGLYINKFFKGRIIDIIIVVFLVCLIITLVCIGLRVANHYLAFFPK